MGSGKSRCLLSCFDPIRALGPPIFVLQGDSFASLYRVGCITFARILSRVREPILLSHMVDLA